jgi:6,7-dimethyl-8-ribityllumazine synthase
MKQNLLKNINLSGKDVNVGIVISEFNYEIGERLLEFALKELENLNATLVKVVNVPGALEIPIATQKLIKKHNIDVIIALGVVIKGETDHYEYVSRESTHALSRLALKYRTPIIQGIITAQSKDLAKARIERGIEYARSAVQMVHTLKNI